MKLGIELQVNVVFYNKYTLAPFTIDNKITKEYDEDSEEYMEICMQYENMIGFPRRENEDKFDSRLLMILAEEAKKTEKTNIDKIAIVCHTVFAGASKTGYVDLAGTIVKLEDFCAVRFTKIETRVYKK